MIELYCALGTRPGPKVSQSLPIFLTLRVYLLCSYVYLTRAVLTVVLSSCSLLRRGTEREHSWIEAVPNRMIKARRLIVHLREKTPQYHQTQIVIQLCAPPYMQQSRILPTFPLSPLLV